MPLYRIADFVIDLAPKYDLIPKICAPYEETKSAIPDLTIRINDETIAASQAAQPQFSLAYHESICTYRAICNALASKGAILFHAAAVKVDGKAYAFSAPSGTGKSTHIKLWHQYYGDRVSIINGDKPILREKDGVFTVYGTPWCGKEGWNKNTSAPLAGLCFLSQAKQNRIRRMESGEAVERIFAQLLKPTTKGGVAETLRLADILIRNVPIYHMECDISEEAAKTTFEAMVR